jgi:hypothetical protein
MVPPLIGQKTTVAVPARIAPQLGQRTWLYVFSAEANAIAFFFL